MPFQISSKLTNNTLLTDVVYANQLGLLDSSKENRIAFFDKHGLLTGVPEYKIVPTSENSPFQVSLDGAMSVTGDAQIGKDLDVGESITVESNAFVGGHIDVNTDYRVDGTSVLDKTGLGPTVVDSYLQFTTHSSFQVGNGAYRFVPLSPIPLTKILTGKVAAPNRGSGNVFFDQPFNFSEPLPKVFIQIHPSPELSQVSLISANVYSVTHDMFRYVKYALTQVLEIAVIINGNEDPLNLIFTQEFDWLAIGT